MEQQCQDLDLQYESQKHKFHANALTHRIHKTTHHHLAPRSFAAQRMPHLRQLTVWNIVVGAVLFH
jgi:hypothetical protein